MLLMCFLVAIGLTILPSVAAAGLRDLVLTPILTVPVPPLVSASPLGHELLVATLEGRIWRFRGSELQSPVYLDLRARVDADGIGLFGFAVHPRFESNGFLFAHFAEAGTGDSIIARYRATASSPQQIDAATEVVLLRMPKPRRGHYGGHLAFGPDGYLYVSTGDSTGPDTERDPNCGALSIDSLEGKILRLDVDGGAQEPPYYAVPDSNPLVGYPLPSRPEVWLWGLRNPWRFSFDRETGDLWVGDVGEKRFEELDLFTAESAAERNLFGRNFGWKLNEGPYCHDDRRGCSANTHGCQASDNIGPTLYYDHDDGRCAIIGGYVYRASGIPDLRGRLVYADLCAGTIWAARFESAPLPHDRRWIPEQLGIELTRINSFAEDAEGEILVLAEDTVYRIEDQSLPAGGVIELSDAEIEVQEASGEVVVHVARLGRAVGETAAFFEVEPGTATPGADYDVTSTSVRWADGEKGSQPLRITIFDDQSLEPDETLRVSIVALDGSAELGTRTEAVITITDDEVCEPAAQRLCLDGGRFQVTLDWRSGQETAAATAVLTGPKAGSFWFFSADNPEVFVKILDACFEPFRHFWVFAAGLTNLGTTLSVVDTLSGQARVYDQPSGRSFESVQDVEAFQCTP